MDGRKAARPHSLKKSYRNGYFPREEAFLYFIAIFSGVVEDNKVQQYNLKSILKINLRALW